MTEVTYQQQQQGCSVVFDSLWPYGLQSIGLFCPWNFPGKNTGGRCHLLLQEIKWNSCSATVRCFLLRYSWFIRFYWFQVCIFVCVYVYVFLLKLFSHRAYYRILSWVPYLIQSILFVCLFYIQYCVSFNPKHLIYLCFPLSPFVAIFFKI